MKTKKRKRVFWALESKTGFWSPNNRLLQFKTREQAMKYRNSYLGESWRPVRVTVEG